MDRGPADKGSKKQQQEADERHSLPNNTIPNEHANTVYYRDLLKNECSLMRFWVSVYNIEMNFDQVFSICNDIRFRSKEECTEI
jgi:hypothetical protein